MVMWIIVIVQTLLLGWCLWVSRRRGSSAERPGSGDGESSQALLDRLSIATQAAGIYCWELDWRTYAITWDASRLPPHEVAAASRRHFGAELGSDLFKWVHPDDQHAGGKVITDALARGENHASFRYRIVLPDQSIRHVQAFARTYCDDEGKPIRSLGVSWDVTAEVEAAERAALNASKERELLERLSVATQAAGVQCWEYEVQTGKITWLDFNLDADSRTPESVQAAGDAQLALVLPEDLRHVRAEVDAAAGRHDPILSVRYRRTDPQGGLRYIQSYHRFFYDEQGNLIRRLGANIDVTESHRRQAELEALSIRFAIATRAAQAGVWEWQERTDAIWWNETMYAIYGFAPGANLPTYSGLVAMIHPDDLPVAQACWDSAVRGKDQLHVQYRVIRPDGSIVHVDSVAVLVTDAYTLERRLVGITLDISDRVAAEERERELQKQLREASHQSGMAEVATGVLHNVGNVLNSLGVSNSTARARLRSARVDRVERVASMIDAHRHDLDVFLSSDPQGKYLPAYLLALGSQLKSDVEEIQQEMEAIDGHVQYLREIVRAQQSFAKTSGADEAVNVGELVDQALKLKSEELKGVQITRELADIPEVRTDRFKLMQIVVNFVGNACDAVADVEPGERRITVRAGLVRGWLEMTVEDSGVGIPPELLGRVWEFGFTTKAQGHGFGLHSAALAAQQLGGSVSADSAGPGQGASFTVKLPVRVAVRGSEAAA